MPGTQGNTAIQPERNRELEVGFDAGFFENRISLTATYYNKEADDFLITAQVPGSSGFGAQQQKWRYL